MPKKGEKSVRERAQSVRDETYHRIRSACGSAAESVCLDEHAERIAALVRKVKKR